MADEMDPQAIAQARARLALRAERAFGVNALPGVSLSTAASEPARDTGVPPVPDETKDPVALHAAGSEHGQDARVTTRPSSPRVDLFGNAVGAKAKPASEAADDPPFAEPPPDRPRRIELLAALDADEVTGCVKCPLSENRTHTVFGEGDPEARLMFIGEGPGENEDKTGRPFVGRAGELLNKMIAGMGLKREQVYIANVVKCRPPGNRVPTAVEVATCTPYLHKQIEWIRPKVIVTLGLPATRHMLKSNLSMGKLRGRWHEWRGIKVMPTYHPAYLLRSYTEANRRTVWGDLQQVMTELGLERPSKGGK